MGGGVLYHGPHILPLGTEGELLDLGSCLAQREVAKPLLSKPEEQRPLGRIPQHYGCTLFLLNMRRGVRGYTMRYPLAQRGMNAHRCAATINNGRHPHLVLGERAGLIGANDGGSPHGFAGVHAPYQIVGLHHAAHAKG